MSYPLVFKLGVAFKEKLTWIKSLHKNSCQLDCKLKPEPRVQSVASVYSAVHLSQFTLYRPLRLDLGSGGVRARVGAGVSI